MKKCLTFVLIILLHNYVFGQHSHGGHVHSHEESGSDSHSHSHSHSDSDDHHSHEDNEKPSFKYSREANVKHIHSKEDSVEHKHSGCPFHSHTDSGSVGKKEVSSVWLSALGSTLLISLAPYIILFFIPLDNSPEYEPWLKVLLSFASGGLLGDAFLHLIPHALMAQKSDSSGESHDHSHSHSHSHSSDDEPHVHDLSVGLWVLAGIIVFLMVEKFVRIINGGDGAHGGHGGHAHSHSHSVSSHSKLIEDVKQKTSPKVQKIRNKKDSKDNEINSESDSDQKSSDESIECLEDKKDISESGGQTVLGDIKVSGYLNLAADFTHNLTDGLAIGASFLAGKNIGIVTTITILLHEIPHEIGDFAILIQSGCSRTKAMRLQLITAVGAFTGTSISLFAEGLGDAANEWILPFTAGGFIYIATVSVIPELLQNTSLYQSIKEVVALLVGVMMMVVIAHFE